MRTVHPVPGPVEADLLAYAVTGRAGPFVPVSTWPSGTWLNEPSWRAEGGDVLVAAERGSDFWRQVGRVRDSGHAYLTPFEVGAAVEVDLTVKTRALLDQAGVLVRQSPSHWLKAVIEHVDGEPHLSTVMTAPRSDWATQPVPSWRDDVVTLRVSRERDSLAVRAQLRGGPWRLVRLSPVPTTALLLAGPCAAAPSQEGHLVRFSRFEVMAASAGPGGGRVPA